MKTAAIYLLCFIADLADALQLDTRRLDRIIQSLL